MKRPTRKSVILIALAVVLLSAILVFQSTAAPLLSTSAQTDKKCDYIKWVEFNVTYEALEKAMKLDIKTHEEENPLNWIELLAYLGARYGGDFSRYKASDMDSLVEKLKDGQSIEELTKDMKHYSYYYEVYTAVLEQFVGEYQVQKPEEDSEQLVWQEKYGLKAFSPIAKTFPFNHFDDFGASRSYGFSRPHVGHDLMAATGTPVVAIESGTVEVMGWNQYGGWRVGIRSFDKKRYYYYAHLRKDRPFHTDLAEGKVIKAGDVIGYVGRTGYSTKENANNITTSHLHVGMQLIFDECQKECNNEIWINLYAITRLLQKNQSAVTRVTETKEFYRTYDFQDHQLTN